MGRAKLPMKLIAREKNRNITFKKRRNGLKKKTYEFATLCDVSACMICFGPQGEALEAVTWPEESWRVEQVIQDYQSRGAEEQQKRQHDLSYYLMTQNKRAEEELLKWKKKNADLLYPTWHRSLDKTPEDYLLQLATDLQAKLEIVDHRIGQIKNSQIIGRGELKIIPQSAHLHENYTNYMLQEMNETTEMLKPQMEAVPFSYMKPLQYDPHPEFCCNPLAYDTSLMPNVSNYNYANYNSMISNNYSMQQLKNPSPPYPSPGYSMLETKGYIFCKDSDRSRLHSSSLNQRSFSLLGGPSPSSSSSPLLPQVGFFSQSMTGMHQPAPEAQFPVNQMGDLTWQFPGVGGN